MSSQKSFIEHDVSSDSHHSLSDTAVSRIIKRKLKIIPRFCETDMLGVIHNAEYLRWFEEGRLQILLEILPVDEAFERGLLFPVVENSCRYKSFARFGDALILTTTHRVCLTYKGRLEFHHSIVNEKTKSEIAEGNTAVTILHRDGFSLVKEWPEDIRLRYAGLK